MRFFVRLITMRLPFGLIRDFLEKTFLTFNFCQCETFYVILWGTMVNYSGLTSEIERCVIAKIDTDCDV